MNHGHEKQPNIRKILASLAFIIGVGSSVPLVTNALTNAYSSFEANSATVSAPAMSVSDASASGGSAVKFTAAADSGGGICNNPFASTSVARGDISIPGTPYLVRNEAWSDSHGPQTIYACNEQSWYVMSNQTDQGGAVQTYPDTLYSVTGTKSKVISQYTSVTSTFAEEYQNQGNWNAAYDIWMNNWSKEIMIWNEWNGGPSYWADRARTQGTAVTLGGVPYHYAKNGTILQFFRDTEVKSGSVDILAALQWLQARGDLTATDKLTQIEYGVEICSTVGTQRFDTTGFTVNVN